MRLYPELAELRSRQIVRDVLVALALVLFVVLAWAVRSAVMSLTAISEGFTSSAAGAQDTWNGVGDSLSGIPLVGDDLQRTFSDLAAATFGNAAETGQTVTDAVTQAANVLALVTFAAPTAVLLVLWLPRRLDRARAWDAAHRVLAAVPAPPAFAGAAQLGTAGAAQRGTATTPAVGAAAPTALAGAGAAQPGPAPQLPPGAVPGGAGGQAPADAPGTGGSPAAGDAPAGGTPPPAEEGRHDTVVLPWSGSAPAAAGRGAAAGPTGAGFAAEHPGGPVVAFPPDELLALRALCHLPFEDLVRFCPRPFEAFAAGDYAPLVAALYAHEGLVPPGWSTRP